MNFVFFFAILIISWSARVPDNKYFYLCVQQVEDKKGGKTKAEQKAELAEELKVEEVQRRPNTNLVRQNRKTLRDFTKVRACVAGLSRDVFFLNSQHDLFPCAKQDYIHICIVNPMMSLSSLHV